jgi:two-component system NtrC family sensor kinase
MRGRDIEHDRHTVLVVDDEAPIRFALQRLLERDGCDVVTAESGVEALALLETVRPCLVLSDVAMPGMDGFSFCRRLKGDPRTAVIPVAMITGRVEDVDVAEGLLAGAVDYIKKPFDQAEVSLRVRAQILLHESMARQHRTQSHLAEISSVAHDAIVMIDAGGCVAHWNEAAERIFGYRAEEALGSDIHTLLAPERYHVEARRALAAFQGSGTGAALGTTRELMARHRSGREFPIQLSLSPMKLDGSWCAVAIARDATETKRAEQALRESELRYKALFEGAAEGILVTDLQTQKLRYANRAWCEMTGYSQDCVATLGLADLHPASSLERMQTELAHQARGDRRHVTEVACVRSDGSVFIADIRTAPIELDQRACTVGFITDVSERLAQRERLDKERADRERMELELRHAQKLEAVGQLAAGIAHEINTPTQFVGDSLHFIEEAYSDLIALLGEYRRAVGALAQASGDSGLLDRLHEAEETADLAYLEANVPVAFTRSSDGISRIATIVRAMKEFAHPDQRDKSPADLNRAIQSTLTISRNEYKYVADIETELGDLPPVQCHIGDLNQVFLNLIVNAAHAIADVVGDSGAKGVIRIRSVRDGEFVRIEISDTGSGIAPTIADRIYEPFFTTKAVGKGSGQGLAIARTIVVDKHRGTLTHDSREGAGATFTIRLPIGPPDVERAEPQP